jgi:hypothetical protein
LNPPVWWATNVPTDCEPLPAYPAARARALAIRQTFLEDLDGRGSVTDVLQACRRRRLFDGLTASSQREFVRRALRPIATTNHAESIWG